ncbi:hypothetical protein GGI02_003002 [Coemansia sp. RSA 2322]|uniref:ATP-dependent (S)-NAD(P)H-hydrate dehydratase n=1 Tax=Coemansia thaxteri TaxID=2663907 RepID=A0A9W8EIZ2_9FUNG|nr:hypothetical protein H4R26_001838 [Coemansia thaxteri]KAJ2470322.1 hypothetical protein GGI02_003002 [Coemansia sp. RSA 2322]
MSSQQPRLQTLAQLVPPLSFNMHKGDCGRIAAIGGCDEYTGAPYFVASTALRLGADLAYVVCEKDAAAVIKSYSPDIIVNPYLRSTSNKETDGLAAASPDEKIAPLLDKLHAVSVGSGMGNDLEIRNTVHRIIKATRERELPLVLDADSLAILAVSPETIHGYRNAVLTPNAPEFSRLCKALDVDIENVSSEKAAMLLAERLGGVTVVRKGKVDVITNGDRLFVCEETGGLRRCGGQGDILSGAIATFLAWGQQYKRGAWKHTGEIKNEDVVMLASYAACMITRHASFLAYDDCGRSTQSTNVLEQVDMAFDNKFDQILQAVKPSKQ